MPASLITRLRLCARPAVAIAAALMLVQAFLAGIAGAQAALVLAAGADDIAIICHGNGGGPSDTGTVPGAPERQHPCCEFCTAGAPPALLPAPTLALFATQERPAGPPALRVVSIPIAPRAVRAGASQAPPASL